jgi:hypothetical protein
VDFLEDISKAAVNRDGFQPCMSYSDFGIFNECDTLDAIEVC